MRCENPTWDQQGEAQCLSLPWLSLRHLPCPARHLQLGFAGQKQSRLQSTLWLCSTSRVPAGWLSQEVRAANEEAHCRGFSPHFGAARLPQENVGAGTARLLQPMCGFGAKELGDSFLPAPPYLGDPHLLSGAGFAGGMRMESCGAEVPKTAQSFFMGSQPLGMACSQPREGAGGSWPRASPSV